MWTEMMLAVVLSSYTTGSGKSGFTCHEQGLDSTVNTILSRVSTRNTCRRVIIISGIDLGPMKWS
jgi:hypothetical protein